MTTRIRYVTRISFTTYAAFLEAFDECSCVHRKRFAGHPAGTVKAIGIDGHQTPSGGWIADITHEYNPDGWDILIGDGRELRRFRVYPTAVRKWWGRHVATPKTVELSPAR